MISVNEALSIVANVSKNHAYKTLSLGDALNYILYEDVISPIDMPPFRQSAMDGYAIKWSEDDLFSIAGETKAGDSHKFTQEEGRPYVFLQGHWCLTQRILLSYRSTSKGPKTIF